MVTIRQTPLGNEVLLLQLKGQLVIGLELATVRDAIEQVIDEYRLVLLDMREVTRIDAAAIGMLVWAFATSRARGTRFLLSNVIGRVREVLLLVRLLTVFGEQIVDLAKAA